MQFYVAGCMTTMMLPLRRTLIRSVILLYKFLGELYVPTAIGTLCSLCPIFFRLQSSPRKHNEHDVDALDCYWRNIGDL